MTKKGTVKKRGSSGRSSAKRRPSSSKRGKSRKAAGGETPIWLHWVATCAFACAVAIGFYLLFIRPFAYRWRPCNGSREYEVCLPDGFGVYGIDVSHHQGQIDWRRVSMAVNKEFPLRFAFIKATEGGDFKDENYDGNIVSARHAGLACGSYLFYNPATSPEVQADFFIRNVSLRKGDLPPVVDIEKYGDSHGRLQKELLECLRILEEYYGVRPIIYTSYKFRKHYLNDSEFDSYQFWIARYYAREPDSDMNWLMWQFSDRGRIDGIDGFTDMNVLNNGRKLQEIMAVRDVDARTD